MHAMTIGKCYTREAERIEWFNNTNTNISDSSPHACLLQAASAPGIRSTFKSGRKEAVESYIILSYQENKFKQNSRRFGGYVMAKSNPG